MMSATYCTEGNPRHVVSVSRSSRAAPSVREGQLAAYACPLGTDTKSLPHRPSANWTPARLHVSLNSMQVRLAFRHSPVPALSAGPASCPMSPASTCLGPFVTRPSVTPRRPSPASTFPRPPAPEPTRHRRPPSPISLSGAWLGRGYHLPPRRCDLRVTSRPCQLRQGTNLLPFLVAQVSEASTACLLSTSPPVVLEASLLALTIPNLSSAVVNQPSPL